MMINTNDFDFTIRNNHFSLLGRNFVAKSNNNVFGTFFRKWVVPKTHTALLHGHATLNETIRCYEINYSDQEEACFGANSKRMASKWYVY